MNFKKFLNCIRELSKIQGFYGRLLRNIEELDEEELTRVKTKIENQHFNDMLDIVMYFE